MSEFEIYELVKFFPTSIREFAKRQLDLTYEEIQNYNATNEIILYENEKQIIVITVFLNLVENTFVKSFKNYQNALAYIKKFDVRGFSVGSRTYHESDSFTLDWKEFTCAFRDLRKRLEYEKLAVSEKSVSEIIKKIIESRHDRRK